MSEAVKSRDVPVWAYRMAAIGMLGLLLFFGRDWFKDTNAKIDRMIRDVSYLTGKVEYLSSLHLQEPKEE